MAIDPLAKLDTNLLVVLDALLKEGGVTAAALRLGQTQPAVSRALGRLRQHFNDPLFVRTRGRFAATPRAIAFAEPLDRALAGLRDIAVAGPQFDAATSQRRFRILASDWLAPLVAAAWRRHVVAGAPGLALDLLAPAPEGLQALASGAIDLAFMPALALASLPQGAPVDRFVRRALFRDRFVTVLPPGIAKLSRAAFLRESHVVYSPSGGGASALDEALARDGAARRIALRVASASLAFEIAQRERMLVTLPSRFVALARPRARVAVPPVALADFDVFVAFDPSRTMDPGHRFVRERLQQGLR
ncbi:MAG: LysR family transcriptional regulator [Alphaproteobacteria bacterium]|nr:LysR family transcriptional regulator [Alphaproteobacteria bacterium]